MSNNIPLNDNAREDFKTALFEIRDSILVIARELAKRDSVDAIQSVHIQEARRLIAVAQQSDRKKEFAKITGSVFLGAFLSGFFGPLATDSTQEITIWFIFFVVLGITGASLITYGVMR